MYAAKNGGGDRCLQFSAELGLGGDGPGTAAP